MTAELVHESDAEFAALIAKIEREREFGCRLYKEKCLRRRVGVRMRARGILRYADYSDCLDRDPDEYERLMATLTINVTKLFRNTSTFDAIARVVIPAIAEDRGPIDVWSAGCASGEEAYSLAILFHLAAIERKDQTLLDRTRVIATDIDRESLETAERGVYPESSFTETPPAWRERFFVGGEVASAVRQRVRFERRDLLRDPAPCTSARLITCRNVLIYFDRTAQEALLVRLHDALAPGGYLVLGRVEMLLGRARSLYTTVDSRERIYRRT
jgi:chemotaxis protein methyltransferase CheR